MDTQQLVEWLYTNAQQGNWRVLIGGALSAVVWFLRNGILRPGVDKWPVVGRLSAWLKTDRGGVALTLLVGILGGVGTALASAHAVDGKVLLSGVINGVIGAGVFNVSKRALKPADKKEKRAAISIPLTMLIAFFTVSCASGEYMFRYDQATLTASVGGMACKDTLSDVNDLRLKSCRKILDGGDATGADQCLVEWVATYKTANDVCYELKRIAKAAFLARGVVATAPDAKAQAVSWTVKLLAAGAKVATLYAEKGIVAPEVN